MPTPTAAAKNSQAMLDADLARDLEQAEQDFAQGDFVDISIEELDRCTAAGEWPWQRASSE